ncbi:hypothetical protein C8J57DRAFT_1249682 [Mycena rebaudengoi]|nr:hypothetical protein C8J57DRAFT_1249682 [Mycena rebaudengoi]
MASMSSSIVAYDAVTSWVEDLAIPDTLNSADELDQYLAQPIERVKVSFGGISAQYGRGSPKWPLTIYLFLAIEKVMGRKGKEEWAKHLREDKEGARRRLEPNMLIHEKDSLKRCKWIPGPVPAVGYHHALVMPHRTILLAHHRTTLPSMPHDSPHPSTLSRHGAQHRLSQLGYLTSSGHDAHPSKWGNPTKVAVPPHSTRVRHGASSFQDHVETVWSHADKGLSVEYKRDDSRQ